MLIETQATLASGAARRTYHASVCRMAVRLNGQCIVRMNLNGKRLVRE